MSPSIHPHSFASVMPRTAAIEQILQDEAEREVAHSALAEEIRARMETPRSEYTDRTHTFAAARATIAAARVA